MTRQSNQTAKKEAKPQKEDSQTKDLKIQNVDTSKKENTPKETQMQTESHM